jgi:hypothetical protein
LLDIRNSVHHPGLTDPILKANDIGAARQKEMRVQMGVLNEIYTAPFARLNLKRTADPILPLKIVQRGTAHFARPAQFRHRIDGNRPTADQRLWQDFAIDRHPPGHRLILPVGVAEASRYGENTQAARL